MTTAVSFPVDPSRVRAVVFDCDGLLLDTETMWQRIESGWASRHGLEYDKALQLRLIGTTLEGTARILGELAGRHGEHVQIMAELTADEELEFERGIDLMPGAAEFVELCSQRVPVIVASNATHTLLQRKLTMAGLGHLAADCIGVDLVDLPKPAPDIFIAACARMSVEPHDAAGFEDSAAGVTALNLAGIPAIMVPTHDSVPSATWVISSLRDPQILDWASRIGQ